MRELWRTAPLALAAAATVAISGVAMPQGRARTRAAPAPVTAVDGAALKRAIDGYRGKVVVVNLWATWCEPCVAEFPDLVRLYDVNKKDGLVVVAVSVDEPEDRGKVVKFLASKRATFPTFIRSQGPVEAFIDPLDREWAGAVPTTYVFDRKGHPVGKPLIGQQSYEAFSRPVQPLLHP